VNNRAAHPQESISPMAVEESPREALVLAEQSDAVYGNIKGLMFGNAIVATTCEWAFLQGPHTTGVWIWLAAQLLMNALGFWSERRPRRPATARNAARRLRAITLGVSFGGWMWAAGLVAFWPPGNVEAQWLLSLSALGLITGAMHSLAAWLPAFRGFFIPVTLALMVANLREGSTAALLYAIGGISFFVANWIFTTRLNGTLIASIRARHEVARLAADLKVEKDRAEDANLAKSRFLAAASHDLRQPVHALTLFVDALAAQPPGPEADRMLARISATVGGMGEMFDALLDVSKLDAGVVTVDAREFDLRAMIENLCAQEGPAAAARGLGLSVNARPVVVRTDPMLLERILRNLVANALRYTDHGGILVAVRRRGNEAVVRVVDTGIGIAPERHAEVFEEFVQLHNPERDRNKGLGLGLAIVRRLTRLLGVSLTLRSRPGHGTAFTLRLPAVAGTSSPVGSAEPAAGVIPDPASGDLLLVIDDDADVRAGMRTLLTGWGYRVIDAAGIADMLPQLRRVQQLPCLILSDYRLRGSETGAQAIDRLRFEYNEDIPAILITGDTAPQRLLEAQASGHLLLHKPVPPKVLREQMFAAIAGAAADTAFQGRVGSAHQT
jgi:signal transduction histidine kinase